MVADQRCDTDVDVVERLIRRSIIGPRANIQTPILDPFMSKSTKEIQILGSDKDFLRLREMPVLPIGNAPVRIVDLFCGCGGITLGCVLAAHDLGRSVEIPLAVDFDAAAIACYKANFPQAEVRCADIAAILESNWQTKLTDRDLELRKCVGRVDMLVGGPPCQGHSDLNNFTSRRDPKNQLMQFMARAAAVFKPQSVVVENVVASLRDSAGIVHSVEELAEFKN